MTCLYVGYKGVGYDVLGMNEADAAGFAESASWIWLVAALGADSWGMGSVSPGSCGSGLESWRAGGLVGNSEIRDGAVKFWWSRRRISSSAILASRR